MRSEWSHRRDQAGKGKLLNPRWKQENGTPTVRNWNMPKLSLGFVSCEFSGGHINRIYFLHIPSRSLRNRRMSEC